MQATGNLEEEDADERVILKWIRKKQNGNAWIGFICLSIGQLAGFCDHGSELEGSLKCGILVYCLRNC